MFVNILVYNYVNIKNFLFKSLINVLKQLLQKQLKIFYSYIPAVTNFFIIIKQTWKQSSKNLKNYKYTHSPTITKIKFFLSNNVNFIFSINKLVSDIGGVNFFNSTVYSKIHHSILITFIRKSKNFIKSRFSKNRAFNRTIVLFSLCINIIFLLELNFIYYNISLNFGYFIYYIYTIILLISLKIMLINSSVIKDLCMICKMIDVFIKQFTTEEIAGFLVYFTVFSWVGLAYLIGWTDFCLIFEN